MENKHSDRKALKRIFFILVAIILISLTIAIFYGTLRPIFSKEKWPEPLMQRVKIEPDKAIEVYFYVPKCINYQTIFLDIAFNAEEEKKQFEDKLETCAKQLHDGSKYTYKCLENPVQWAIFDAQGKEVIKGKIEKIPARKGKDIYTPSLEKSFIRCQLGGRLYRRHKVKSLLKHYPQVTIYLRCS